MQCEPEWILNDWRKPFISSAQEKDGANALLALKPKDALSTWYTNMIKHAHWAFKHEATRLLESDVYLPVQTNEDYH